MSYCEGLQLLVCASPCRLNLKTSIMTAVERPYYWQTQVGLARLIHAHSRDSQMWVYKALICMDDLVSRPSRSPDRCELRHVSAIRFPAGCPVRLAGCWRQAGGGRV